MRLEQRAWIDVRIQIDSQIKAGEPLRATVKAINTGKTPAKKVSGTASIQKVASNETPKLGPIFVTTVFHGLIPPGGALPLSVRSRSDKSDTYMTETDIEDFRSGKVYVAVLGKFGYEDVYGTSHWIKYCTWKSFGPGDGKYSAGECVNSNEVDENS